MELDNRANMVMREGTMSGQVEMMRGGEGWRDVTNTEEEVEAETPIQERAVKKIQRGVRAWIAANRLRIAEEEQRRNLAIRKI